MDHYKTPADFYERLDREYHFDDDPCPFDAIGLFHRGLERSWGRSTFVNPPYSNPRPWIEKAITEAREGKTVVMLLRSDTSTEWFHELVLPWAEIRWLKGRLKFTKDRAPFPVFLAIFRKGTTCLSGKPLRGST